MRRVILLFATLSLFAAGCCNDHCECLDPGFTITYESDSTSSCYEDAFLQTTKIYRFNATTHDLMFEGEAPVVNHCVLHIPYKENRYWVIKSDSLGIADTLRIQNISLKDADIDCCDCPPYIESSRVTVNGRLYGDTEIERIY